MSGRTSYRHGDVRSESIARALDLIEEVGEQGITMRALAQQIGVAHRTLHHHFTDREGLLLEVGAQGFAMLAEALDSKSEPVAFVQTYLRFGLARPQLYALMMRQRAEAGEASANLAKARNRVIGRALAVLAPGESDPEFARRRVMRTWMMLHGGLLLNSAGTLVAREPEQFVIEMLRIIGLAEA